MIKLRKKIKVIKQNIDIENNISISKRIIITFVILIFLTVVGYILYFKILPIFNEININKISGKKINITECNTKDYIIIGKDKSYSMYLTNDNCKQIHYEGNIKIYKNKILLNDNIFGIVNSNNTITINNNKFESE